MPRMKVGSQYYTAKEANERLQITQGELNTFIRNGTLKPETPPGKKQGVYKRSDVDRLALERQAFMALPQKTTSTFGRASKEDMKAIVELTRILFGLRETPEETLIRRLKWLKWKSREYPSFKSTSKR